MAYETGVASSTEDLMDKLFTFVTGLSTTPWTEDNFDASANKGSLHLGNCYVHFLWDDAAAHSIGVFQSLGYVDSSTPQDQHTNDSGNGNGGASPVTTERRAELTVAGPYVAYHFFAYEDSEPTVYVVIETTTGIFRHAFGFGNLVKANDFTGGEFAYGCIWDQTTSYADVPNSTFHTQLLDATASTGILTSTATVHVEGMPNGPASHKWGVCASVTAPGNDGDGNGRVALVGGSRNGLWAQQMLWMRSSHLNTYKVIAPIPVLYRSISVSPYEIRWLGHMPHIGVVNMAGFSAGDEVTVGSDTWMVFPWVRKQYLQVNTQESGNGGYAYKKVV